MAVAQTVLVGAIDADDVSLTAGDDLGFAQSIESSDVVLIDGEFILVQGGLGTSTWTSLTRGYASSTAAAHENGATIYRVERGYTDLTRIHDLFDETDSDDDSLLLKIIDGTNTEMNRRIGLALYPSTDTVRLYSGDRAVRNQTRIWVPGGLRNLTAVRIGLYTGADLAAATLSDFMAGPETYELPVGRPQSYVDCVTGGSRYFPAGRRNIEFTASFGPAAVYADLASLADMVVMRTWEARGSAGGSLTTPTPSKFIFAQDDKTLDHYARQVFTGVA